MKRASFSSPDDAFTAAHSGQGFAHAAPEKRRALDRRMATIRRKMGHIRERRSAPSP